MTTPFLRRLAALSFAGLALAGLAACQKTPVAFQGIDITGADYARQLNLTDADGQPRTLADFKGKVAVVFFGLSLIHI